MQINFTLKKAWLGLNKTLLAFLLLCFVGGTINAQTYVNSNLSTGPTATGGGAAPAGYTWSELQPGSTSFGVSGNIAAGVRLGDDFTVPAGNTWNLTSMTFFGYQTGFAGTTSPFTTIRVTIHSGSITGPVVFGDQTTNRLASTTDALMYRIANGTPGTTRRIWAINATTVVTLPAGTYWIEYATNVTGGVAHFLPLGTVVGTTTQPGNNAQQNTGTAWAPLLDGTNPQDMPFRINYTSGPVTPCLGTPAPGNTITSNAAVCPGTGFSLSLQNATPGSGVTYQWQSASSIGGPYTPVVPAQTNATYSVSSITTTTFYQAVVTCGGNSGTSTPVQVTANPPSACYCASSALDIEDEDIFNVTVGTLNNSSTCATTAPGSNSVRNRYSNYTGYTGAPTGDIFRGLSNSLSIQIGTCGGNFGNGTAVFIDYNQDGDFIDAGERVYGLAATITGPHTENALFTVPVTALAGATRMRVINVEFSAGTAINPCGTYTWGETEDYTINIVVPPACTGTPAPGNTLSTASAVCPNSTGFTLSLQNNPAVSGLTYQWFSSPTATGTFTPITNATSATYTVGTLATATCYYAAVTCSGVTTNSSTLCIAINPPSLCYCASAASSPLDEDILRVTVGTLNNTSTCTTLAPGAGSIRNRYSNYTGYTGAPAAPNLVAGDNVPFSVQVGTCGGNFNHNTAIFIDFNQDGDLIDAGERVFVTTANTNGPGVITGNLVIPATATLGNTRMRVINVETTLPGSIAPCATYTWGETEDYIVNITPCIPITVTSLPTSATIACGGNASFTVATTGTAPMYQWQFLAPSTTAWQTVTNVAPYSNATTATLSITNAPVSLNGFQYRVLYSGGCTGANFTAPVTLTVTPYIPAISPTPAVLCVGSSLQLFASPPPTTTTVASAANLNIAIPDGVAAGINHAITMANIPAGATVSNITVKVNIPHTYVADLMLVVKAPNGNILNLSNLLGGQNAPGVDFTNTNFSGATGLPALSTGTSPGYTGTFRPDAAGPVGAFGVPSGPTGFIPNVTTFNGLGQGGPGSAVNGTWTIAMFDAGPPDVGSLKDWSVSITWGVTPATAVFSPNTNLFLDAALTIPYNGTAVNSVYTNTAVSTTYTAAVSTGTCSATVSIPVTVNTALVGNPTVANVSTCAGSNAVFSYAGITAGTGLTFQWQVSTTAVPAFTDIAGATSATYTVPAATAAQSGNSYRVVITAAGCSGSRTSTAGVLTVNPLPIVTISAAPVRNLFPGLTTTLTAAVSPNATGAAYQWFRNGVAVAGATSNTLVVGIDGVGTYRVRVTDANGCVAAAGTSTPGSIVIGDSANVTKLFIYPSPNNGVFQVRYFNDVINNGPNPGIINVYDSKGTRVFTKNYNIGGGFQAMNVDLGASHGSGIYRVDLLTSRGERIKTGSVIIF